MVQNEPNHYLQRRKESKFCPLKFVAYFDATQYEYSNFFGGRTMFRLFEKNFYRIVATHFEDGPDQGFQVICSGSL
jgi:hypothetical protein